MNSKQNTGPGIKTWVGRILAITTVIVVVFIAKWLLSSEHSADKTSRGDSESATTVVKRGPLRINITESGSIRSRQKEIIKNSVEGSTTILWIIEEGKHVKADDLLIELDSSKLEERKLTQEISVQNAKAELTRVTEELAVAKSQAESDISKAELQNRFAKEDLEQYINGQYPQQLKKADSEIKLAQAKLKRAEDKLEWSTKLAQDNYLSRTELEGDQLAKKQAELDLELANSDRDLLTNFTYKRELAQLESDVEQAEMALERVKRKATAEIVEAEADLTARDLKYRREKDQYDKIIEQIEHCTIISPVDGMVVYPSTGRGRHRWRGDDGPLEEGQNVHERQELFHLPTADEMTVEINLQEASLDKVSVGMPARVTIGAKDDKVYMGTVSKIGILPDGRMAFLNPDMKVYATEIDLDESTPELRPGMSCDVEIILADYKSAVYVPVQCVLRVDGEPVVYMPGPNGPEKRVIETGLDNNRMIKILNGLEPGEEVLLAPPLEEAAERLVEPLPGEEEGPGTGGQATGSEGGRARTGPRQPGPATQASAGKKKKGAAGALPKKMREKLQGMSPEERREWFEGLSDEERAKLAGRIEKSKGGKADRDGKRRAAPESAGSRKRNSAQREP